MEEKDLFHETPKQENQENTVSIPENNMIVHQIRNSGLEQATIKNLEESFLPFYEQTLEWKEKALALVVTNENQKDLMKQARDARLILKNIRTSVEKTRKILKEDSKKKGQIIDTIARTIENLIVPSEEHLEKQEKFIEIQEAERKEALKNERIEKLKAFDVEPSFYNLSDMPDEQFDLLLESSKTAYNNKKEAEERAERERIENERIDKLHEVRRKELAPYYQFLSESQRIANYGKITDENYEILFALLKSQKADYDKKREEIKAENERLRKENEEKERLFKEEQKKRDDQLKARSKQLADLGMRYNGQEYFFDDVNVHWTEISTLEEDKWNKIIADVTPVIAERKKAQEEKERKDALHNQRKESVLHLWAFASEFEKTLNFAEVSEGDFNNFVERLNKAKFEAEDKERERLRKEATEKAKREIKEQQDREAEEQRKAEVKAQKAAEKKEKLRPDKEKLISFAKSLKEIIEKEKSNPNGIKSEEAIAIFNDTTGGLIKIADLIIKKAHEL